MAADELARVLEAAGEPPAGPRPDGWEGDAMLARMRESVAVLWADRAAKHARHADQRRRAREQYQRVRQQAGGEPGPVPPWLRDEEPPAWIM
jgi:hypothetical protein